MKLVSFEVSTPLGPFSRVGALLSSDLDEAARIVDLNLGYTTLLLESGEPKAYELANVAMPSNMIGYLEGGARANERASQVLDYLRQKPNARGSHGETLVFDRRQIRLLAPVPRPPTIRDFSTYEEHSGGDPARPGWYFFPACYRSNPGSMRGPEDDALYPA